MKSILPLAIIFVLLFVSLCAAAQCTPPAQILVESISPTSSNGVSANPDGKLRLFGFLPTQRFQYVEGSVFNAANIQVSITTIPNTGIIVDNLLNPNAPTTYTVRVYDAVNDGCFADFTSTMYPTLMSEIKVNETFTLKAPDSLSTVQWFLDGAPIAGGDSSTITVNTAGRYAFAGTTPSGCTQNSCSPLELRTKGTLPVKMLYFNANVQICDVIVRWATASELNAKSFDLYRALDGVNYVKIASFAAAGTTNIAQYYEYKDNTPFKSTYYKLVQTDFDGKSETFNLNQRITTTNCDSNNDNGISALYPNPNSIDQINVRFFSNRDPEEVRFLIHDMLGREVSSTIVQLNNGATLVNLATSDLPSGTYSVKVIGDGWYSLAQKFVRISN